MKKYLLLITIFLLFLPIIVFAEEEFTINSIEKMEITGKTEEEANPTIDAKNIDYSIRFYNEGDSIKYKLSVTNNTNDKLIIKDNIMSLSNKNIKYELEIPDGISSIEKGSSKDLIISINYIKKAKEEDFIGGLYKRNDNIEFTLRNNQLIIGVANTLSNSAIKVVAIALIVLCIIGIIFTKTRVNNKITMIFILFASIALIPNKAKAVKELKFNMIGEIIIELNPCFVEGDLSEGFTYQDNTYTYKYNQQFYVDKQYSSGNYTYTPSWKTYQKDGWGVKLTDENTTSNISSTLCTSINKKPITSLSFTFYNSKSSSIDTSSINYSKVSTMEGMFSNAINLTNIELENAGSDILETVKDMFFKDESITKINMSHFKFGLIENIYREDLFQYDTPNVTEIDLSYSDMPNNTTLEYIFRDMHNLKTVKLNNVNMPKVTNISYICYPCENLEYFDLSNSKTDSLSNMMYMFKNDKKLSTVNYEGINLENLESANYMFANCESLTRIDFSEFTTPKLKSINQMFNFCKNLEYINLSNWGSDVLNNDYSFVSGCTKLKTLIMNNFNFGVSNLRLFENSTDGLPLLETLEISNANFSKITTYNTVFANLNAPQLKKIDMSNSTFGTSMGGFFNNIKYVEELDLTNSDVTNVQRFDYAFSGTSFKEIKTTGLSFNSLVNCNSAFYNSKKLESLDFTIFKMDNVTDAKYMFSHLENITKADLSKWNLSGLTQVSSMLGDMTSLTEIKTPKVNSTANIDLPKRMYAKNDTAGVMQLNNSTPTETTLKSEPWN